MKYLCLAYGAEEDWRALTEAEQDALLAADEVIRERGALMAAVDTDVVTVHARDGSAPSAHAGSYTSSRVPLAGFSVIEAADLQEVIALVAKTPCAQARGAIEIRSIHTMNDLEWRSRR